MHNRFWRGLVRLVVAVGLCAVPAACREERTVRDPATEVQLPKNKSAREFQAQAQSDFVGLTEGAAARLVWVEDPSEASSDTFAEGETLYLMGWDTREGGPRRLVAKPGNFGRPMLTPDGRNVVFTEKRMERRNGARHFNPRVRIVEWETGKITTVGRGLAVDTWADPETGRAWIYALEKVAPSRQLSVNGSPLVRFAINDPDHRETVWTRSRLSADSVQISRDGRRFSALFPWPDAGIGDVASGRWTKLDVGCWPALAPDDSYVAWVFDGPHRNLRMVAPEGDVRWQVNLSAATDLRGKEVYHPRWSSHPRFMVFTGPYTKKKKGGRNAISSGGLSAEIHVGRFAPDLQRLEATARLTRNKNGDFYPDLWVDGAETATLAGFPQKPAAADPASATWPPSPEGLIFAWRDLRAANEVPGDDSRPPCHLEARAVGRFSAHLGALLDGGSFEADTDSNQAIAASIRAGRGLTLQAMITESPGAVETTPLPLLAWQSTTGEPFVSLVRAGANLTLAAGAGATRFAETIPNPPKAGVPIAIAIVRKENTVRLAIDGSWAGAPITLPTGLGAHWHAGRLVLGGRAGSAPADTPATAHPRAAIERVTAHQRALSLAELGVRAETDHAAAHGRTVPPRLRLRARVLEATDPDLESLDTYRRMLVDHTYEVTSVLEGVLEPKKISVLHWAVLDDRAVPGFPREIGSEVELDLEPHAAHPELQGELTDLGSDEFDLPLFLDVATPAAPRS